TDHQVHAFCRLRRSQRTRRRKEPLQEPELCRTSRPSRILDDIPPTNRGEPPQRPQEHGPDERKRKTAVDGRYPHQALEDPESYRACEGGVAPESPPQTAAPPRSKRGCCGCRASPPENTEARRKGTPNRLDGTDSKPRQELLPGNGAEEFAVQDWCTGYGYVAGAGDAPSGQCFVTMLSF